MDQSQAVSHQGWTGLSHTRTYKPHTKNVATTPMLKPPNATLQLFRELCATYSSSSVNVIMVSMLYPPQFWLCALSDALAAHKVEFDASRIEYGLHAYQSQEEVKQRIFQAVDQILAPNSSSTRVLWSKCVREALQQFSAGLGSGMRRISARPVQEPDLISGVNVEMTGDAKWMEDWMGCLAAFLDSEYDRLERALKAEIASNIWVGDKKAGIPPTISAPISSAFVLSTIAPGLPFVSHAY
ncbi:hypothetical protein RSAG8_10525, partial [Rhizoctonia solani AG-8 WAC10335]